MNLLNFKTLTVNNAIFKTLKQAIPVSGVAFFSWLVAVLLILPVIALIITAFSADSTVFNDLKATVLWDYTANTLLLIAGVCLLATLFGVVAAWFVVYCQFPGRRLLQWALVLPLAMPSYIVAYVYTDLFDYAGPVQVQLRDWFGWQSPQDYWFFDMRTLGGAVVTLSLVLFPYVYLITRSALMAQSDNLMQAGQLLGCSVWQRMSRLVLPMVRPAISVAASLVAMETLADFGTVHYFALNTLTTAVYDSWLGYGSLATAAKISVMMLFIMTFLIVTEQINRRRQRFYQSHEASTLLPYFVLKGWQRYVATFFCLGLVIAGFLLPFLILVFMAIRYFDLGSLHQFFGYVVHSLSIATIVAVVTLIIALLLSEYSRFNKNFFYNRWRGVMGRSPLMMSSIGYAMPGTVLAIGVMTALTLADHTINDWAVHWGWQEPGLILSGSVFAIVFAFIVRFTAVACGTLDTALGQISPTMDFSARLLSHSNGGLIRRIHLPLLRKSLVVAFLLVFLEAMKELPAALLLRPFQFETLATWVYQFISDEMLEQGALGAVCIVLLGLPPLLFLNRSMEVKS